MPVGISKAIGTLPFLKNGQKKIKQIKVKNRKTTRLEEMFFNLLNMAVEPQYLDQICSLFFLNCKGGQNFPSTD